MARISEKWIAEAVAANPVTRILNAAGQPTGNIRTCPVRLSFPNIFKPGKVIEAGKEPKFGASLLFPRGADLSVMVEEATRLVNENAPGVQRDQYGRPYGIHLPFRDQGEKGSLEGYTAGCAFMNVSSKFKPQVVDARLNPIVDESRVYPGVWAICSINAYWFNDPRKKGVSFGLQSVMIVADDEKLAGGGASNPNEDFAGVAIQQDTNVAAAFGMPTSTQPAMGALPVAPLPAQPGFVDPSSLMG